MNITTIAAFLRKEFAQALRDPRMKIILFVVPVVQLALFGLGISTEIKNIRLGALHAPNDVVAAKLIERCLASRWFVPPRNEATDPYELINTGAADAVIVAPPGGIGHSLARGQMRFQLLVNATNVLRAQAVESYVTAIASQVAKEWAGPGAPSPMPLSFDVRVLYNPALQTSVYTIPAVMSMILTILTIILTSMALAREKEGGTFETLIAAPVSTTEILLGKTVPYIVIAMIDVPIVLSAAVFLFGVPMRGSLALLLLGAFTFVCATVSIGILISTIARTQQQAMMGGFIFLFPAVLLSGIMFPVENMPLALKWIAYVDPLKYFVAILRNCMLKGGDPTLILQNIAVLALMGAFAAWVSVRRFRHTLN